MFERTLSIVKPDAMSRNLVGTFIQELEEAGFRVAAIKLVRLSKEKAEAFYEEHKAKPFFSSLVSSITSAPVVIMVLEGEDAILKLRELMGATDPAKAAAGTLRQRFGLSIEKNSIHGSDSPPSAKREIELLFSKGEIF